jgi:hypothetical protein
LRAEGEEMTEQEELIQEIRERLGEMPKGNAAASQ